MSRTPLTARVASVAAATVIVVWSAAALADATVEGCPPWCPAPPHVTVVSPHAKGRWYPGFAMRIFAIRASTERTAVSDATARDGSVGAEDHALGYLQKGWLSARYSDRVSLGYGDSGFDGGLSGDAAVGLKAPLGATHGPFVRLGARGEWLHAQHFHDSFIELPQAQLGYSVMSGGFHLDLAARGGYVWVGRYGVDGARTKRLGDAPEIGTVLGLGLRPIRVDLSLGRISSADGRHVDDLELLLCGAIRFPVACLRGRLLDGTLRGPSGTADARAAYVGISLGLGSVEWR